jgi:hypothetical protein
LKAPAKLLAAADPTRKLQAAVERAGRVVPDDFDQSVRAANDPETFGLRVCVALRANDDAIRHARQLHRVRETSRAKLHARGRVRIDDDIG